MKPLASVDTQTDRRPVTKWRFLLGSLGTTVLGGLLFALIGRMGSGLSPSTLTNAPSATTAPPTHLLEHLLLALTIIVILARLMGALFQKIHQPPVIGEVVAGIVLGPSLLGQVSPEAVKLLFPPQVIIALNGMAQFGIILFMFVVGLELNADRLRERPKAMLAISQVSILCPFLLGSALALYLYPRFATAGFPFLAFALFMGVTMSITAFPVLARILTDRGIHRSRLGVLALTCAAVDDVLAWCMLAFVVGVIQAQLRQALLTIVLTLVYIVGIVLVVRPLLHRLVLRHESAGISNEQTMAWLVIGLFLSCLTTEYIGIHALFGAFLMGAIIPHQSRVAHMLTEKIQDFVTILLLPAFFALTGLRTQIGLHEVREDWVALVLILLVAFGGKYGGTTLTARFAGLSWRESSALGVLMNTRGLVELIVLNVGLDLNVLTPRLFALFVIMAVVTTFMTSPILDSLLTSEWRQQQIDEGEN